MGAAGNATVSGTQELKEQLVEAKAVQGRWAAVASELYNILLEDGEDMKQQRKQGQCRCLSKRFPQPLAPRVLTLKLMTSLIRLRRLGWKLSLAAFHHMLTIKLVRSARERTDYPHPLEAVSKGLVTASWPTRETTRQSK